MLVKKIGRVLGLIVFFAVFQPTPARALGFMSVYLMGGMNDTINSGGGIGYLGGAGLGLGLGSKLGIEGDALYLSRNFGGSSITWVQIPLLVRFKVFRLFNLGLGGYLDQAITAGATTNKGFVVSLRIKPPALRLFLEGRVNYGLNSDTVESESGAGLTDFQVMAGIKF